VFLQRQCTVRVSLLCFVTDRMSLQHDAEMSDESDDNVMMTSVPKPTSGQQVRCFHSTRLCYLLKCRSSHKLLLILINSVN